MDLGDLADLAGLDLSVLESFKDFKPKNMSEPKFSVPSAFPGAHMGANINMDNILDHFEGLKRKSSLNYTSIEDQDDQMLPNQDFSNISLDHGLDDTIKSMLNDFRTSIDSTGEIKRSVFYSLLVIYILAIIVGFCGNLLIVTAVLGRKRMRTARNVFIVTLAISDTTLCIFTMPFTLWEILYRQWPLGRETEWLCRLAKSYQTTPMFMSSFSIMAIALDRYRCIMQPDKRQLTTNVSVLISLAMVLVAFGMSAPLMLGSNLEDYVDFKGSMDGYLDDILICNDVRTAEIRLLYNAGRCFVQFVMPLSVVVGVYISIFWRLLHRPVSQHSENHRRRRRTNIMIISVSVTFFLSWLPLNAINFMLDLKKEEIAINGEFEGINPLVYGLCVIMGLANACINPILYGYLNESFREEYKNLFKRLPWMENTSVAQNQVAGPNNNNGGIPNGQRSLSNRSLKTINAGGGEETIPLKTLSDQKPNDIHNDSNEHPVEPNDNDDSFLDILKNNKPKESNGHCIQAQNSCESNGEKVTYV